MKCEYKNCNEERSCFHYCHRHHQEVCMGIDSFEGLEQKMIEYLNTLDDEYDDERYTTDYGFARRELVNFLEWLGREVPEELKY